jgi:hypothetical protein
MPTEPVRIPLDPLRFLRPGLLHAAGRWLAVRTQVAGVLDCSGGELTACDPELLDLLPALDRAVPVGDYTVKLGLVGEGPDAWALAAGLAFTRAAPVTWATAVQTPLDLDPDPDDPDGEAHTDAVLAQAPSGRFCLADADLAPIMLMTPEELAALPDPDALEDAIGEDGEYDEDEVQRVFLDAEARTGQLEPHWAGSVEEGGPALMRARLDEAMRGQAWGGLTAGDAADTATGRFDLVAFRVGDGATPQVRWGLDAEGRLAALAVDPGRVALPAEGLRFVLTFGDGPEVPVDAPGQPPLAARRSGTQLRISPIDGLRGLWVEHVPGAWAAADGAATFTAEKPLPDALVLVVALA